MFLRFIGAVCCLCAMCCAQFKVAADNRVTLNCSENRTNIGEKQNYCALRSTRCLISGYKIDRKDEIHHPKEAYYISCLIFDKTKINMLPAEFFSNYTSLKYIDISQSKLHKIADFTFGLPSLLEVNLSGNDLFSLTADVFDGALNLHTIDISNNMISIIHPEAFLNLPSLRDVDLSNNQLNNNSFGMNGVDWIEPIESLRTLDLSYNNLFFYDVMPYQAFSGLINLETLILAHNQITIDFGAFASNQFLKTLDFSYNKMTYFDLNFLMSVSSLENLYLHGNGISYANQIDMNDIKTIFPNLKSLGISANSFSCQVLSGVIKKMLKASIKLAVEEGNFVNNRRNLHGVACV